MRKCATEYALRGHAFRPGDAVVLSDSSANCDVEVVDDPSRFDIGRSPNQDLAFGFGVRYCLGDMLARMEMKVLLIAYDVTEREAAHQ